MRITLSGAMRARDVSRPSDEQLAAAAERESLGNHAGRRVGLAGGRAAQAQAQGPTGPTGPSSAPDLAGAGQGGRGDSDASERADGEAAAPPSPAPSRRQRRRGNR